MDSIYSTYKVDGTGSGMFLKMQDGDIVQLRIASEPAAFQQSFEEQEPTTRFAWVVWNRTDGKAQVFNGGKSIYRQIADLYEDWGDPQIFDIKVKRSGTGLETRYTVTPAKNSEDLTKEQTAECDKIDLLKAIKGWWLKDLDKKDSKPKAVPANDPFTDEDMPPEFLQEEG